MRRIASRLFGTLIAISLCQQIANAADPSFSDPGTLEKNSGQGYKSDFVFLPEIRFPLEDGPAFANSQVYRPGGSAVGGDQCDSKNYSYPWRDNYCESRGWAMPLCPASKGHQGQDIRPSKCKKDTYWAVAAVDGQIATIGSYAVSLQGKDGTVYRYLHLQMNDLAVKPRQKITRGQRIGKVSNWFGDAKTTIHLHFDVKGVVKVNGKSASVFIPSYTSLKMSYLNLLAGNP